MKYLIKFNENLRDEILGQNLYSFIDEVEFDDIRKELEINFGADLLSEQGLLRLKSILEYYFNVSQTGIQIKNIQNQDIKGIYNKNIRFIIATLNTGNINLDCHVNVSKYDDYFVIQLNVPIAKNPLKSEWPEDNSIKYILSEEGHYLIDGWDGLREWAKQTSPYYENLDLYSLLQIPINNYQKGFQLGSDEYVKLTYEYPCIRDWSNGRFYFFDDGFHFGTVVKRKDINYFYGSLDKGPVTDGFFGDITSKKVM